MRDTLPPVLGVGCSLSVSELRGMASRQQEQIEAQQQLLVAREQRLKFLKQQQQQGGPGGGGMVAPDHDRLRRMRDRVDAQEAKLRRLRALRGQVDSTRLSTASLTSDLDAMRQLFSQKEKEMVVAVARVDELTRQLEALRTNNQGGGAHRPGGGQGADHHNELDKLRRELLYRNSVNRESSGRVTSQRDLLSAKTQELARLDKRIAELQTRLHRKKMLNHQLAQQITKATQAKQAQLRAVKEKSSREGVVSQAPHTNTGAPPTSVQPTNGNDAPEITDDNVIRGTVPSEELSEFGGGKQDPKYQTLPYNTKLCHRYPGGGNGAGATAPDNAGSYAAQNTHHPPTETYPPSSMSSGGDNYNTNVNSGGNINSNNSSSGIVNNNSNAAVVANTSNIYNNNNNSNANAATPTGLVAQLSQTFEATMAMQQQHQTVSDFLSNYSNNNNSNSATTNNSINSNLSSISTLSSNSNGSNSSGVTRTVHSIPMNKPSRGHAMAPVTTSAAASGSSTATSLAVVASMSLSTAPATASSSTIVATSAVKTTTVHANSRSMSLSQQHQQQKQQYQQQQQQDMSAEQQQQQQQDASSQYSGSAISKPALPPKPAPSSGVTGGISNSSTTTTSPSTTNQSVQPPTSSVSSTMAPSTPFNGITTSHSNNKPATPPRLKGDPGGSGGMVENNSKAGDPGNKFTSRGYNQSQATTATTKNLTTISKSASKLPVSSNRVNGSSKSDSAATLSSTSLIASTISSLQARSSGSASNGAASASTRDKESPLPTNKSNHGTECSEDTSASNNSRNNNANSTSSSNNGNNYSGPDANSSSDPGSQNRAGDDGQETSDHSSQQQQLQYQADSRIGGGKGPEKGVHVSINRRIEMPPDFLFPENETPPSDLLGRATETTQEPGSEDALDRTTGPQQSDGLADQLMEQKTGEGGRLGGVARRKGNLKTQGSLRLPRRVSFDPLALLLDASLEGELELVKRTAMEVPNPSAANDEGITALHNAICAGHLDIVTFLVTFGCDVNAQDSDGWTPLHCAASCNNLAMVRFLVEHGACILATTLSDHETPAEKCEQDEEGYDGCSQYLYSIQEKLGILNGGLVYAVYDYSSEQADELSFKCGDAVTILRRGDEYERDWWWGQLHVPHSPPAGETGSGGGDQPKLGYLPRNLLGLYPRVKNPVFSGNDTMES